MWVWFGHLILTIKLYRNKSMPLASLMPLLTELLQLGLIELHSLQFGDDAEQMKPWLDFDGVIGIDLNDFSGNRSYSVNSISLFLLTRLSRHLAGALNRPTCIGFLRMLIFVIKTGQILPWYPSMRLFRQRQAW